MFDEQFHQFIASRTALPLPFSSTTFDASFPSNQTILLQYPLQKGQDEKEEEERNRLLSSNLELDRERSVPKLIDPWSNDEVLALLRIRSSMENWFPDFTWEHVSRYLNTTYEVFQLNHIYSFQSFHNFGELGFSTKFEPELFDYQ